MRDEIQIVTDAINSVKGKRKLIAESKRKLIEYYTVTNIKKLETISIEKLEKYCFRQEVMTGAMRLQKIIDLKKIIVRLETHKFAPELNCLHFKNGQTFKVKGLTNLDEAILYAAIHLDSSDITSLT